jgi:hypothetical protein
MNSREEYAPGANASKTFLVAVVARAEIVLVDVGVVDAVDHHVAERHVVDRRRLGRAGGDVVLEAQAFEEVLVHDVRARRDDRVDHVVLDERDERLLEPAEISEPASVTMTAHPLSASIME